MLRLFDIIFSALGLIFGLPVIVLLLVLGIADTGSPLFIQIRVGRGQKPFKLIKLRTMKRSTASVATHLVDPAAVTRWGKFLRAKKLDELPQLWNVLVGEMSFVGPRPCLISQKEVISERIKRGVFDARPGITGLAQIKGVSMAAPQLLAELDAQMLKNLDISAYLGYIFQTVTGSGSGDRIKSSGMSSTGNNHWAIFGIVNKTAEKLFSGMLNWPRASKRLFVIIFDASLCLLTVWLAFYLRLGEFIPLVGKELLVVGLSVAFALPTFIAFGLYRIIYRYSGWPAFADIVHAIVFYGFLFAFILTVIGFEGIPRTIGLIQPILLLLFLGLSRYLAKIAFSRAQFRVSPRALPKNRVLIYGAGQAGRQLAASIVQSKDMSLEGFLDDDERLHGNFLDGQMVFDPRNLQSLVQILDIHDVLLAIPSIPRSRRHEILSSVRNAHVSVRTLPTVEDLVHGRVGLSDLRELDLDDLLARGSSTSDENLLSKNISKKTVLILGAGDDIGLELCSQILDQRPSNLLMLEQSESLLLNAYLSMENRLKVLGFNDVNICPLLISMRDKESMRAIFSKWRPDTVFHATNYRHTRVINKNICEVIKHNIFDTVQACSFATNYGASNFIMISTDKAGCPNDVMGATNQIAELVLHLFSTLDKVDLEKFMQSFESLAGAAERDTFKTSKTCFSSVRLGNILGSSGSVLPKFRQQIRAGGPITLSHPEASRYFITIREAVQLIIQAGAIENMAGVFSLDVGEPIKIIDLAKRLINLSGLKVKDDFFPDGDIEIQVTGLGTNEDIVEARTTLADFLVTEHPRIFKLNSIVVDSKDFYSKLIELKKALHHEDEQRILDILKNY